MYNSAQTNKQTKQLADEETVFEQSKRWEMEKSLKYAEKGGHLKFGRLIRITATDIDRKEPQKRSCHSLLATSRYQPSDQSVSYYHLNL